MVLKHILPFYTVVKETSDQLLLRVILNDSQNFIYRLNEVWTENRFHQALELKFEVWYEFAYIGRE